MTYRASAGGGDMSKSVYDPLNVGIVSASRTLETEVYFQGAVAKGDPVYVTGFTSGYLQVNKSQASTPSTLPAFGLAKDNYGGGATGRVIVYGLLSGLNTSSYSLQQILYVGQTGGLSINRYSPAQQSIAVVLRTGAGDGVIGVNPQPPGPFVYGHSVIADLTVASQALPTTPTPFIWPNVRTANADLHYDPATGIFTFRTGGFFTSAANWAVYGNPGQEVYFDAEASTDGGTVWNRGLNSMRKDQLATAGRTAAFPFAGYYPANTKIRFLVWSTSATTTVQTTAVSGSTAAASRITTTFLPGAIVVDF